MYTGLLGVDVGVGVMDEDDKTVMLPSDPLDDDAIVAAAEEEEEEEKEEKDPGVMAGVAGVRESVGTSFRWMVCGK